MSKTVFSDVQNVGLQDIAVAEKQRASQADTSRLDMLMRIREFNTAVQYVVFESEDTAPEWASNWFQWLTTGNVPQPAPDEAPASEADLAVVNPEGAPPADETLPAA